MTIARPMPPADPFCLPEPEHQQDEKTANSTHLSINGNAHHVIQHLGNFKTTVVGILLYLVDAPTLNPAGSPYPDLLVAFDTDPEAYDRSNGYIIAEQGKPPDFVLEIASASTGIFDVTTRRAAYAALGVLEYWRFDATGEHHGTRLAGDRLSDGRYLPIPIDVLADDILQGHSQSLNLLLRWQRMRLGWYNPATGYHIETFSSVRTRADLARADRILAEARADIAEAQTDRIRAEARADRAEARADRAKARIRQLEAQLHNQLNP